MKEESICLLPALSGTGGPVSFQGRLKAGLVQRGVVVHHDPSDPSTAAILVIGGPWRSLPAILQARRRGVRVVQRLNGMYWIHRVQPSGVYYSLRCEWSNTILALTRRSIAQAVVYQSEFTRAWWNRVRGPLDKPERVIHNGIDLVAWSPRGPGQPPAERVRILLVEAIIGGGYELGLHNALGLAGGLAARLGRPVELQVAGAAADSVRAQMQPPAGTALTWLGTLPTAALPEVYRSAHLLFSADLNPACPNSVIEALACGVPVLAYDTGALSEMLDEGCGRVVPYGADHWRLQPADPAPLVEAAGQLLEGLPQAKTAARKRAEEMFGIGKITGEYLEALLGGTGC